VHTALAIQRAKYSTTRSDQRKNATLLFYDEQPQAGDQSSAAAAITTPPEWALEFLGDRTSEGEFTAIVDTAYFVDSVQAPLIQVADFIAYMIQRKAALDEGAALTFGGEADVVNSIFEQLEPLLLERSHRLPRQRLRPRPPHCGGCRRPASTSLQMGKKRDARVPPAPAVTRQLVRLFEAVAAPMDGDSCTSSLTTPPESLR
jgi:hypothetical protein